MPNGILRLVAVYKQILFYILVNFKKKLDLKILIYLYFDEIQLVILNQNNLIFADI